uniref:Uncharacterized protein n=1 Tax=Oncorhynchus mykiss TaxID=8022 RepID=A0A8K9UMU6_ONCMY
MTHLMLAVREEVELLWEQIKELSERNQQPCYAPAVERTNSQGSAPLYTPPPL